MKKGESQRIYWQQWIKGKRKTGENGGGNTSNNDGSNPYSRRELITSSAAIRLNPDAAKASDVTQLLRDTLKLSSLEGDSVEKRGHDKSSLFSNGDVSKNTNSDALVLVGTLYSLPKEFVQFEHELPVDSSSPHDSNNSKEHHDAGLSGKGEPFHVVRTLKPDENPLMIRDSMIEHLSMISTTATSKIQWYYVPHGDNHSPVSSCIDLDGYCTSMEEEEDDDDDDDDDDHVENGFQALSRGLELGKNSGEADENDTVDGDIYYDTELLLSRCPFVVQKDEHVVPNTREERELRRYFQLCQVPPFTSGYLLKQSRTDPHVWRRVYCVLTNDHLWYTTRVPNDFSKGFRDRHGKHHGRISLSQALVLEPNGVRGSTNNDGYSPLLRIPYTFEVMNARGMSHSFRATSFQLQRQWLAALKIKITESFENSLLDQAGLIIAEETLARNRRITKLAIDPLHPAECDLPKPSTLASSNDESLFFSMIRASVLHLGLDIAEYRELCRHGHALLPAKEAVVAFSNDEGDRKNDDFLSSHDLVGTVREQFKDRARAAWERAGNIWNQAANTALEVQQYVQHRRKAQQTTLSSSLETNCRHIEYVLRGHYDHQSATLGAGETSGNATATHEYLPPIDLFDSLLSELQGLICESTG